MPDLFPCQVQQCLGVCPQHDVLWETLTCEVSPKEPTFGSRLRRPFPRDSFGVSECCQEHLKLFAGFKGVPAEVIRVEN